MVLVKNWEFCDFVIVDKKVRKRCFSIFKKGKTPFQTIKTTSLISQKIEIFPNGLRF